MPRQAVTSPRRIQTKTVKASPTEMEFNWNLNVENYATDMAEKPSHRSVLRRLTFDQWLVTKE